MTQIPFYQVDAFTDVPFKGNPAAICLLEKRLSDATMQQIAQENNLAETAYVLEQGDGYSLRWFTPTTEIKLCGHGTLATAHILWQKGKLDPARTARFFTRSGLLEVDKKESWIQMKFPRFSYKELPLPNALVQGLCFTPVASARAQDGRWIAEAADEPQLRSLKPDFTQLREHESVVVTCKGSLDSPYDFLSRSFAPSHGVDEDPVTGSSHCALAPYWADRLDKSRMLAFQASARGGELQLELTETHVLIAGKAVTVIEGIFTIGE